MACLVALGKAIDFATVPEGHFKVGERTPGDVQTPAISKKDYDPKDPTHPANGHTPITGLNRPGSTFLPLWLQDGFELLFASRGIGWDWGKGAYIPAEHKPLEQKAFLMATIKSFCINFMILDVLESCIKLVPAVGTPRGGTIFLPYLDPLERYSLSTAIHFATGFALLGGFQMVYDLMTLVGVGLLQHDPTSWPPVLDRPWVSTSLHEFWAKRWHQLLRQTFLIFGGFPGKKIGGNVGMVLGTFLASGVYHELSSMAMGRGFDPRVLFFFAIQGVFLIVERVWRIVTGYRVGGWLGRIWVYFIIGVLGQPLGKQLGSWGRIEVSIDLLDHTVDAWHKKGLAGGMVIPPLISPTRQVLFPLLSRLTGWDLDLYPL